MYKLAKASAGVSQIGIDEKGYLILNYPKLIESVKKGEYFSYYAVIEQYIFEKVKWKKIDTNIGFLDYAGWTNKVGQQININCINFTQHAC